MIYVRYYEGSAWLAVSAATGEERVWSSLLAFAPGALHLAVAPMKGAYPEDGIEALQIWEITGRGVATVVGSVPPPCPVYSFEWQGPETILVKTDAEACGGETTTQVRRGAGGRWGAARQK
jgi:hypothetical protein